jgi:hypothetical protein
MNKLATKAQVDHGQVQIQVMVGDGVAVAGCTFCTRRDSAPYRISSTSEARTFIVHLCEHCRGVLYRALAYE